MRDAAETTRRLIEWVGEHVPDLSVAAAPIGTEQAEDGVLLLLVGLAPRPEPRSFDRASRTLALDYLITVRSSDPLVEQGALVELAFAAMDEPGVELVADPGPASATRPAAGLLLRVEARRSQEIRRAPPVRQPLIARLGPIGWIEGMVVGPDDRPVAGAVVTLAGDDRPATTGLDGRFRIIAPPDGAVEATARARSRRATAVATPGKPAVIKLAMEA